MQARLKLWILVMLTLCKSPMVMHSQSLFENYTQQIPNSTIHFNMISVQGGEFLLGSANDALVKEADEMPAKTIRVSNFWMAETEVVYDLFQLFFEESKDPMPKVDGITRPSPPYIDFTLGMGKTGGFPANSMQQYGAIMFCKWLYQKTGVFYRLPTEVEWEYAAKLNLDNKIIEDSTLLSNYEWYGSNAENKYHKVASKQSGKLGLYDMLGNVSEWTLDQYDNTFYSKISDGAIDPLSPKVKRYPSTVKGGHYNTPFTEMRVSNRTMSDPIWNRRDPQIPKSKWWNADAPFVGFRLVRPTTKMTEEEISKFFETYLK
jgi:formylglycine-generating enzyme required for sulfatase activity